MRHDGWGGDGRTSARCFLLPGPETVTPDTTLLRDAGARPYFMYVGNFEAYQGIDLLLTDGRTPSPTTGAVRCS